MRPITIELGMTKYAATPSAPPTGGTIYTFGAYTVHAFTADDTFIVPSGITVDALIVAGGGAGGANWAGAGGAGGLIFTQSLVLSAASYNVKIGLGAPRIRSDYRAAGTNGNTSSFANIITLGGGGGAGAWDYQGKSGGSGGGAIYATVGSRYLYGLGTVGPPRQGYDGGPSVGGSGGGGGAGGPGANGTNYAGAGGVGLDFSSYFSTTYGVSGWFAGGGGAGCYSGGTQQPGPGGQGSSGGGGNGNYGANNPTSWGQNGITNTGGGGGGNGSEAYDFAWSGAGGSGIVLIRYLA